MENAICLIIFYVRKVVNVFPYVFPLQLHKDVSCPSEIFRGTFLLCHSLNVCLHSCGTVFLHLFWHMTVYVKGKGSRRMTEISLHGFHVVAVLEGEDGEGVPEIMHTAFRSVDPCGDLFIVQINNFRIERLSGRRCEYKSGFLFLCVLVPFPQTSRLKTLFELRLPFLSLLGNFKCSKSNVIISPHSGHWGHVPSEFPDAFDL